MLFLVKLSVLWENNMPAISYGLKIKCLRHSQVSVSDLFLSSAFYRDLIFQKLFVTSFQAPKINCLVSGKGRVESSASLSFGCDNLSLQCARCSCCCYALQQVAVSAALLMDCTVTCQLDSV